MWRSRNVVKTVTSRKAHQSYSQSGCPRSVLAGARLSFQRFGFGTPLIRQSTSKKDPVCIFTFCVFVCREKYLKTPQKKWPGDKVACRFILGLARGKTHCYALQNHIRLHSSTKCFIWTSAEVSSGLLWSRFWISLFAAAVFSLSSWQSEAKLGWFQTS